MHSESCIQQASRIWRASTTLLQGLELCSAGIRRALKGCCSRAAAVRVCRSTCACMHNVACHTLAVPAQHMQMQQAPAHSRGPRPGRVPGGCHSGWLPWGLPSSRLSRPAAHAAQGDLGTAGPMRAMGRCGCCWRMQMCAGSKIASHPYTV